jgi:methyltransferase (TIGR00027 family)
MSNSIFRKDGTAQGVAKQRLIESIAKPDKRVIYDPYAKDFVQGAGLINLMGHNLNIWLTKKMAPGFHEHLIARTRFIDDLVEKAAAEGIEQYVILGAGYDLRAHRLKLSEQIRIFEVDQPDVQERKRAKLSTDLAESDRVVYVGVDFNHQTLKEQLLNAGYDQSKSAVFTLEGVSQYISKEAVRSTLNEIKDLTADVKATFYISYVNELINKNPEACFGKGYPNPAKKIDLIKNLSARVGEPWISFYASNEIDDLLKEYGFSVSEDKTLADLNDAYFGPVGRRLPEHQVFNLEHSAIAKK